MTLKSPSRLSYSSISQYAECGERWRLGRGYKLDNSTWFATIAGSALHYITEQWDLKEMGLDHNERYTTPESFGDLFRLNLAKEIEQGREVKASGKVLKNRSLSGGPKKKDRAWWEHYGPVFVQNYIDWRNESSWIIAIMPDGKPAIEVKVEANMGDETFLGFIDRVFITDGGEGDLVVCDIKSGNEPYGFLQLATYKTALKNDWGIDATWGTYWLAAYNKGEGGFSDPVDLGLVDDDFVRHLYRMARDGIEAGVFMPNVTMMCKGCPVREYCRAVGGQRADLPIVEEVVSQATAAQVDKEPSAT